MISGEQVTIWIEFELNAVPNDPAFPEPFGEILPPFARCIVHRAASRQRGGEKHISNILQLVKLVGGKHRGAAAAWR